MHDQALLRYSRHIMMPEIDYTGQQALVDACVLIVGLGGLGAPATLYLAASGVGQLVLADFDQVELSNLQRQIIHDQDQIGVDKAESAKARIAQLNPEVTCTTYLDRLDADNLPELVQKADVVLDCSDNFTLRFALNQACRDAAVPVVSGAAIGFHGQVTVFDHHHPDQPCYRCLYQDEGEQGLTCSESGVLSPLVGMIGSLQAAEAIKLITGAGEPLIGRLAVFDLKYAEWRTMRYRRDPNCPVCHTTGNKRTGKQNR